jgi:hypothetical protein
LKVALHSCLQWIYIIIDDSGGGRVVQASPRGRFLSGYSLADKGKSSLLSQFVDGKYDEHLLSTIGVDFKFRRVRVGSDEVKLQIWDTAGIVLLMQARRPFGR